MLRWEKWTGSAVGYYAYSGELLIGRVRQYDHQNTKKKLWEFVARHIEHHSKVPSAGFMFKDSDKAMAGLEKYWDSYLAYANLKELPDPVKKKAKK